MISAMMFITPKRCQEINFSEPTCALSQGFMVKKGNPLALHSYEDLAKNSDAVFCAMDGTEEINYARNVGIPASRIFLVPDTPSGIAAIKEGKADALAVAGLTIQILSNNLNDPAIEQADPFTGPFIKGKLVKGYGDFGFRKGDDDFLAEFNSNLTEFVGSDAHFELVKPFGYTRKEFPENMTSEQLCNARP